MTAKTDQALLGLEREVGVLLRRVRRVLRVRATMVHQDLPGSGYVVLATLHDDGPQRAADIVEDLDLDKGVVSRLVGQLIELGLATRSPDPADGRASILAISEQGKRLVDDISAIRRVALEEKLSEWSDDELTDFVGMLRRYNELLSR